MTCTTTNSAEAEGRRKAINDGMADKVGRLRGIACVAMTLLMFALYAARVLALQQGRTA